MLDRIGRILRANIGAVARAARDRIGRVIERFDERPAVAAGRHAPEPAPPVESPAPSAEVRKAFAALELPLGARPGEIRRAYHRLMSRYHPDRHASDPAKSVVATELARRITEAYDVAVRHAEQRERRGQSPTTM